MFPPKRHPLWRLAADGPSGREFAFARQLRLAQIANQAFGSCTLAACVFVNRYPSPSGRPDPFGVRPFLFDLARRSVADDVGEHSLRFSAFVSGYNVMLTRNSIGGRAICSNSNSWPAWLCWSHLQAASKAMAVASTQTARLWVLRVARHLAQSRKMILRPVPFLAVSQVLPLAMQACATDTNALTARGRVQTPLKAIGASAPVAFSFA